MMFKGLDKDGDEKISKDELKAAGLEDPETWMKKHDKDGDNHLNYEEFLPFYKEFNETKEKKHGGRLRLWSGWTQNTNHQFHIA